ncbi:DUF3732 domain-containing protein [Bacillus sp. AFS029533]|uniref:DUF3732 domain-containing protein n=1 Tax=Bacillus sp. AFS029533 TaxID=2033494 RepID=UPI000BFCEAD8|nr:DUF3732 domain-containing protein [Bacillus sp. AFS029533]PGZ92217.1 hypothetical protein COE53_12700 [Bacillus sp. AFS029533]
MKFVINKILLWLENDTIRELEFLPNKVNVITGDSGTGKSAILDIIDYCFFASKTEIPDEKINENVKWYGLNFSINNKNYTLARRKFKNSKSLSKEYYFSGIGLIPHSPASNLSEKECKSTLEQEFSINKNVVIPYGGKKLSAGSKISLRYFFMFNTQSEDIITSKNVFFDKQNEEKYREALERVFDIATGIESVENILIKEKIKDIESEINKLEKKKALFESKEALYEQNKAELVKKAKEYNLIDSNSLNLEECLTQLQEVIFNYSEKISTETNEVSELKRTRITLNRKIKAYKNFKKQYEEYKEIEGQNFDSLKPVKYIKENYYEVIETPEIKGLLLDFENELNKIKTLLDKKYPINLDIDSELSKVESELKAVESKLTLLPEKNKQFTNDVEKYIFIGEIKKELSIFSNQDLSSEVNFDYQIEKKQELLEELLDLSDESINRELAIKLLEELVENYLEESKEALGTYAEYKALFDYKNKRLKLRKPGTATPSTVGSSSNHLFLHLCLFLGLHEFIIKQNSPYVPQFLILDQPSRPYYGEDNGIKKMQLKKWEEVNKGDKKKITIAMKLLNDYIKYIKTEYNKDFQIIMLEHIPKSIWNDAKLEEFHLVEEFVEGVNALINI